MRTSPVNSQSSFGRALLVVICISWTLAVNSSAEDAVSVESRLARTTQFLSSDALEGRGLQTRGIQLAAERIAEEFSQIGLRTDLFAGEPFQGFAVTVSAKMGSDNQLALVGPPREGESPDPAQALVAGKDFNPLAIGGSGSLDLPLVFVGYGITSEEAGYDDYAGQDVDGKAVIILRHEPQQDNPHSAFDGTAHSRHATFASKVSNAAQHGAKAVLFVTGQVEINKQITQVTKRRDRATQELAAANARRPDSEDGWASYVAWRRKMLNLAQAVARHEQQRQAAEDPVLGFRRAGGARSPRDLPVVHVRHAVIDRVLAAAGKPSLARLEKTIDEGPKPASFALSDWRVKGKVDVRREQVETSNVLAVLEGEGPLAEETIVIGAHYDHLGRGEAGSAQPGDRDIHNGADDNASGIAALLQIARQLTSRNEPLARRVLFIAFSGEERGLLGSAHYTEDPLFPLENTVAMLNLDMVGRMQQEKLIVNGTGTAQQFDAWIDEINERVGFQLSKSPGGWGPSDHASFYAKEIPVLHFFTGIHDDYHRPTDDFEHVNLAGMRRISEFVTEFVVTLAQFPERPTYVATGRDRQTVARSGDRPYFGSIPKFPETGDGYGMTGVAKNSPAGRAGFQAGDRIIRFGEAKISNLEDFDNALRKYQAGDRVKAVIMRGGEEKTLEVTLDPPR